jgi:hypothetical protein
MVVVVAVAWKRRERGKKEEKKWRRKRVNEGE